MKKIIISSFFLVFALSTMTLASKTKNFIVVPDCYNKFNCFSNPKVLSSEDATNYALCDEYVKKSLLKFQDNMDYKKWQIISEEDTSNNEWVVRIKSKGFIPSASCLIKINFLGHIYFKECQFNK